MRRADRGVVLGLYRHDPDRRLLEHALRLGVCGVDTAYNYRGFTGHRLLADTAGDLLDEFTVSTKAGYFPGPHGHPVHSLRPRRLRMAIEQSVDDLGRRPDVILLHNPEQTLRDLSKQQGRDRLTVACAVLSDAVASGLAQAWGVSSWNPQPLVDLVDATSLDSRPAVLLVRAGLTVPHPTLVAAETVATRFGISAAGRWGMSPFAGSTAQDVWRTTDLTALLAPGRRCHTVEAAFRLAFELPAVCRIAVGTSNPKHVAQLVAATDLVCSPEAIDRYRELIRADTARTHRSGRAG